MGSDSPNGSTMKTSSRCVICNEIDPAPKLSRYGECQNCYRDRKDLDFVMPVVAIEEEEEEEEE